jgi:chromosome segregation protein
MRLERIEIIGFKSFAEKTIFNFHPGITAIVGPNGCGKSNVVDAFKWVLGEQSAKSLRGDSMEDVIFFGSTTKKTKGMAEVTLVLSDVVGEGTENKSATSSSGGLSVTRRLFRSGESEYLMNKTLCRLKDIKNMFLDTGLELKAYSILEQGKMNSILNSKPQERRFIIEEAAGVMKYKVRKAEALQKLESSKSNLQRLQDIINEVKRQINSIDRYAKKAEKYKKLFDEIKDIDVRLSNRNTKRLKVEIDRLTAHENTLKNREAELSANLHSAEALIEEKKRGYVGSEKAHEEIRTKLYSTEKVVAEGEGRKELLKRDCQNMRERIIRLSERDGELEGEKETAVTGLNNIKGELLRMEKSIKELESTHENKNASFSVIESDIEVLEEKIEVEKSKLFNRAEEISVLKNEIKHLSATAENITRKTEKSFEDINTIKNELSQLENVITETGNEFINSESELSQETLSRNETSAALEIKKGELIANEETLYRDRENIAALNSKLDSLKEIEFEQRNKAGKEIKTLCQVADIFETSPEYENAIEAVLGEKLSVSVVRNKDEVTEAINLIKKQNKGRSGFISINHVEQNITSQPPAGNVSSTNGVIGKAIDLVKVKEGHDRVASSLLTEILIVDNLDTAFSEWERSLKETGSNSVHFVTTDGEVLEPSGIVFGGVMRGVLKVRRQIKEIERDISAKKEEVISSENSVNKMKSGIIAIEESIAKIEVDISNKEKYCHELKVRISSLDEEKARLQKNIDYLTIEKDSEEKEKERMSSLMQQKEADCRNLEDERDKAEQIISGMRDEIIEKKRSLESARLQLTEIKLDLTAVREKMTALSNESRRLNSAISEIDSKKADISKESLVIENEILGRENEITRKEEELKSSILLIDELKGRVSVMREALDTESAELSVLEERQKGSFSELDALRKELSQVEVKNKESSLELKYIIDEINRTYSVDIETVEITDEVSQEEEERLPQLKEKLQSIGPVSLGTLEEFEELKTRFDFLKKQQDDLLTAISSLEETIQKINNSTKQRLTEAFEALNIKFKEVFNTLFGEGKAELILTEGDILESGIEIIAQPPGKKLKNLTLLSGGEQALTALSLLFAGFMVKPTPMCLLDEVDAPLDESNTERFSALLMELSKKIQFITITHNRRTMEAAEYIYGITMEEPGVSNVVSMHLAEA